MKKICHLTSVHSAFDIRIFHKECKTLIQAGYEVVFIVPHDKGGEVEGIQIRALPKPKNRFERITRIVWKIYRSAIEEEANIYHFHDVELIPLALLLKLYRKKVIYDVHEDYSKALLSREWIPSGLRWLITEGVVLGEWVGMNFLNGVIAATPSIAKRFPIAKTTTVQNFPFLKGSAANSSVPYQQREKIVAYVGAISAGKGAKEMIRAMELLRHHFEAKLKLVGAFSPLNLEDEVKNLSGWKRVEFIGWQTHRDTMSILRESRMGLVLFHPEPNHIDAQPNKLFEYMSAGIPVIASDFPLWRTIVGEARCGLLVDPLNPNAIAEAIEWLLMHSDEAEAMGERGKIAVQKYYNWGQEAEKLVSFYGKVIG